MVRSGRRLEQLNGALLLCQADCEDSSGGLGRNTLVMLVWRTKCQAGTNDRITG